MSVPAYSSLPPTSAARIDFGWIGQAWTLFSAQPGVWIGALFLSVLIWIGAWGVSLFVTGGWSVLSNIFAAGLKSHPTRYYSPTPSPAVYQRFALEKARDIPMGGINAVFIGGLYRMALRQKRGEAISVTGLFSALPQSVPLFLVGIVVPILVGVIEGVLIGPRHRYLPTTSIALIGNAYLFLGALIISPLMFAPLLVLDTGASAPDAILGSVRLLRGQVWKGIWFNVAASFILSIAIGYFALTQPAAVQTPSFEPAPVGVWPPPPRIPEER